MEAKTRVMKAELALKLFQEEKKSINFTFENTPMFEAIELRKQADIKDALAFERSMRDTLKSAIARKYRVDEEVDNLIKTFINPK